MNTVQTAGVLFIVGSAVFLFGAGIGVPRVFTEPDPHTRLRMLEKRPVLWRVAQPFYGLGAIIAGAGAGNLVVDSTSQVTQSLFTIACGAMIVGALAWCWSLYQSGTQIADFVFGRLPGWLFLTYVPLTIVGPALMGVGMLVGDFPTWLAWLILVADVAIIRVDHVLRDMISHKCPVSGHDHGDHCRDRSDDFADHGAGGDGAADLGGQAGDDAGPMGVERLLHLHRLKHDDRSPSATVSPSATATFTMVPCMGLASASPETAEAWPAG